jgi:hypothetical protein
MIIKVLLMPQLNMLDVISKNINITMSTSLQEDGIEIARTVNSAMFGSSQLAEVIKFIGNDSDPLIAYLKSIWS